MPRTVSRLVSSLACAGLALPALAALADAPGVVTDIAPVHGLVAAVMQGVGQPVLLLPPGSSPHDYALRPSEARGLQDADLVVWVGEGLTPWLEKPLDSLAADAAKLELLAVPDTELLGWGDAGHDDHDRDRDHEHDHDHEAAHEEHAHAHDAGHAGHDDHAHDAHDAGHAGHDHDHEAHAHEEAAHGHAHGAHDGHDGHDHGAFDPHAWLSPHNAIAWVGAIADDLSRIDPDNAATYARNAAAIEARIGGTVEQVAALLAPVSGTPYVVQHDAYRYFEAEFALSPLGAIADTEASAPGPHRVAALRDAAADAGAVCVFAEPQFAAGMAEAMSTETGARMAILDPLGAEIPAGPDFYPALLLSLGEALSGCLAPGAAQP